MFLKASRFSVVGEEDENYEHTSLRFSIVTISMNFFSRFRDWIGNRKKEDTHFEFCVSMFSDLFANRLLLSENTNKSCEGVM